MRSCKVLRVILPASNIPALSTLSLSRPLTEGKRRAGMGKPFGVSVGGVIGALKLPASSES